MYTPPPCDYLTATEPIMAKHCWHIDSTQFSTWTPGEAKFYTCCFCGEHAQVTGTVERNTEHGQFANVPRIVRYVLPVAECEKRTSVSAD